MNDLYIYENMLKLIKERRDQVTDTLCFGPVIDWTGFKELRGKLGELAIMEQELKALLEKVNDD
jgi:hypothetical protein|tara:strand:- start:1902 stop:2093 length:192 start_codon:yes stop_codon:yes gene_type:complete